MCVRRRSARAELEQLVPLSTQHPLRKSGLGADPRRLYNLLHTIRGWNKNMPHPSQSVSEKGPQFPDVDGEAWICGDFTAGTAATNDVRSTQYVSPTVVKKGFFNSLFPDLIYPILYRGYRLSSEPADFSRGPSPSHSLVVRQSPSLESNQQPSKRRSQVTLTVNHSATRAIISFTIMYWRMYCVADRGAVDGV